MSRRPTTIDARDDAAFQALVADVTPLPTPNRVAHELPRPRPVPGQRPRDERDAAGDALSDWTPWEAGYETGEESVFARPGLPTHALRRLRRGHCAVQAVLDLHGYTSAQARTALVEFLARSRREDMRCVRIIHGKGMSSPNREPVLKRKVASWLMQRDDVLAFCQARRTEGGGGAVVVLLRA